MDVSADPPVLTANDVPSDSSWVPTTPAKPNLTNRKPICVDSQENEAVHANWLELQIVSQGNRKGDESNLEMERLPLRFPEETQIQAVAEGFELANSIDINRSTIDINNISRDFDTWEAAVAAKAQVTGEKAVYDNSPVDDADKWTDDVSFGNLLALAHAAATDTVCSATTGALNAVTESLAHAAAVDTCCDAKTSTIKSITESLTEESYFQNLPANSSLSDQDLLHGTKCWTGSDQVSGISSHGSSIPCRPSFDLNSPPKESTQFQFAPITPNKTTGAYTEQVFNVPSMSVPEPRNVQERGLTVRDLQSNELLQQNDQSQLVVDQSSAGISTELQDPDWDSELNKTPQQKPKRKKHRPKVVIEGQPKRTYKPRTPKPPTPEGTMPSKRKYIRRNEGGNVTVTPAGIETDGTASTMGFPGSQEMPVAKRTYVRRKGVDNLGAMSLEDRISRNDDMIGQQTRSSCRRSLNFDSESHSKNGNSELSSNYSGARAVGIAYDLNCAMNQVSEGYASISQRQVCGPSTPPKNHQPTKGRQNERRRGKCQIVFSDATHDKEVNFVQMMMKSPCSPNSNSSACLTQETQARGSKRLHSSNEAEFCSINVTGAHYNSLQSYLRCFSQNECNSNGFLSMHFPEIHKKRRTEKGHESAMGGFESIVTDAENCSTNKASAFNKAHTSLLTTMSTHGMLATRYDSSGDPTRYALVSYNAQQKQNFNCLQALGDNQRMTKRRSKGPTRGRASLRKSHDQLSTPNGKPTKARGEVVHQPHNYMVGTVQNHASVTTKKRSKRNSSNAPPLAITWKPMSPVDEINDNFRHLDINARSSRRGYEQNALISYQKDYQEQNALVVYQRDGTIVPFNDSSIPSRKRKPRPKVDLDDETGRVWKLLLEDINNEGIDGTDEEKAKWWEEERKVFRGRTDSFIARMHLVQGDRRFSPWKGSVVDSVVGVFLTQNVSDHLSSSAFMSLAALYPLKSENNLNELHEEQAHGIVEEPEVDIAEVDDRIAWHEKSNQSTCGQVFSEQQYVENDRECPQSSSCGTKSTDNSLEQLTHCSQDNLNVFQEPAGDRCQTLASSVGDQAELYDIQSSQNSVESSDSQTEKSELCSLGTSEGETISESKTKLFSGSDSFVELLQMAGTTILHGGCNQRNGKGSFSIDGSSQSESDVCITENKDSSYDTEAFTRHNPGAQEGSRSSDTALYATENSELSAESANQATFERTGKDRFEEVPKSSSENENTCDNHQAEVKLSTSEDPERSTVDDNPREPKEKPVQSSFNIYFDNLDNTVDAEKASTSKAKGGKTRKEPPKAVDWDSLRKEAQGNGKKRAKTAGTMDSLDWEAIRRADVRDIADAIKARGMNNKLAERIKDFLDRIVREHGSIDLEWLRDVPPDKAKEYLLSIRGLGLKSVECVRLLTLHHLAFPVDTNVGRIAVRLGWVPLQPLPESLQLHLLEMYPVLESIQKYLWPRLCKLDQRTLYELHYQMITFGKVFCTKSKPNCNACPMRGECRHFASAFASARFALPAPEEKTVALVADQNSVGYGSLSKLCLPQANERSSVANCSSSMLCLPQANEQNSVENCSSSTVCLPQAKEQLRACFQIGSSNPVVEVPASPEPTVEEPPSPEPDQTQVPVPDIEDFEDPDEIPTIKLNMEEFTQNLQMFVGKNMELQEHEMSKALVALSAEAASIPVPKLKNTSRLRTEHHVYELPDSHPLVQGLDRREPDDPSPYLLSIWTPGETAESIEPPERKCSSQECGTLCDEETCFSCSSLREANSQTVRGTLLIPCRTAMRGSFPLNGTYFQVNEVFADHESSINPIDVPRSWIWNLPRRTVYFGTSASSIFRGLNTEEIQYCFWRGFVCVRGFEKETRVPRPLVARFHFPASKMTKTKGRIIENE